MMRKLGLVSGTALVIGNMIGSGIFLLPASLAGFGKWGVVGWGCSAAGAMLLAGLFRSLARIRPSSAGGPYAYVREALGEFTGFAVGWGYWVSIWCTNAAIAVAAVGYLGVFFPFLVEDSLLAALTGLALIWGFTAINALGLREVAVVQSVTAVLKILALLFVAIVGLPHVSWAWLQMEPSVQGSVFNAVTAATTLTLFAFLGMESAAIASHRLEDSGRNTGRATVFGTGLTAVVYILCSVVVMGVLPPESLSSSTAPFADAAETIQGGASRGFIALAAIVATLGALNGWILIQGQVPMAMAEDGVFPSLFSRCNRFGSPILGIGLSSLLASGVLLLRFSESLVDTFTFMMTLSTLSALLPYALSALSLVVLLRGRNDAVNRQVQQCLAVLAMVFCAWVIFGCGAEVVLYGFTLLVVGLVLFALRRMIERRP